MVVVRDLVFVLEDGFTVVSAASVGGMMEECVSV